MVSATTEVPRNRGTSLAERVLNFLSATYRGRHGVKRLAGDAAVSPRTAENWLSRLNGPGAEPLLRLMAVHPELQQQINEDIALLRRVRLAGERARGTLHEMDPGDRAAVDRKRHAVGVGGGVERLRTPVGDSPSVEGG